MALDKIAEYLKNIREIRDYKRVCDENTNLRIQLDRTRQELKAEKDKKLILYKKRKYSQRTFNNLVNEHAQNQLTIELNLYENMPDKCGPKIKAILDKRIAEIIEARPPIQIYRIMEPWVPVNREKKTSKKVDETTKKPTRTYTVLGIGDPKNKDEKKKS